MVQLGPDDFDTAYLGPLAGALSGRVRRDPTDDFDSSQSAWDIWDEKRWLIHDKEAAKADREETLPSTGIADTFGGSANDRVDVPVGEGDLGDFNLEGWLAAYENGRIPDSALAAVTGTQFMMEPHAAAAMSAMIAAAKADGVELGIGNSYRDYDTQAYADTHDSTPSTPTAPAGQSNHGEGLAADFVITPENHAWLAKNAGRFGYTNPFGNSYGATENWHWEYGMNGSGPQSAAADRTSVRKPPAAFDPSLVPLSLAGTAQNSLPTILGDVYRNDARGRPAPDGQPRKDFKGKYASINEQLYQGFMDANRPGLARMVGTPAMNAWISAESGFDPHVTSPANNNGLANDGLFQIWRGHEFNSNGQVSRMSPYEQAQIVAEYFDLTVSDIELYYEQIQANTYAGWG